MALLHYAAKFDPFISLDCAPTPSTPGAIQGKDQILPSGNPDCLNFPLLIYPCDISEGKHEGEGGGRHRGEHDALARAHHGLGAAGDRQEPAAQERNTGMRGSGQ